MIRRYWLAAVLFTGFGGLLAWQLFLPGFIGIADTNDFARVTGWLCLAPSGAPTTFTFLSAGIHMVGAQFLGQPVYVQRDRAWMAGNSTCRRDA